MDHLLNLLGITDEKEKTNLKNTIGDSVKNYDNILDTIHESLNNMSKFLTVDVDDYGDEITEIKNLVLKFKRKLSAYCSKMIALYKTMLRKGKDDINKLKKKTDYNTLVELIADCDDLIMNCQNLGDKMSKNWKKSMKDLALKWLALCGSLVAFSTILGIMLFPFLPFSGTIVGLIVAIVCGIGFSIMTILAYINHEILLQPVKNMVKELTDLRDKMQNIKINLSKLRTTFEEIEIEDDEIDELKALISDVLIKLTALKTDADTLRF